MATAMALLFGGEAGFADGLDFAVDVDVALEGFDIFVVKIGVGVGF